MVELLFCRYLGMIPSLFLIIKMLPIDNLRLITWFVGFSKGKIPFIFHSIKELVQNS